MHDHRSIIIVSTLLAAVYCGFFTSATAASLAFTDGLPNFSDEVHARKFDVDISHMTSPKGQDVQGDENLRIIKAHNSNGEEYSCLVPTRPVAQVEDDEKSEEKPLPSKLLNELEGICLARTVDWWTYEVCYQQQVRQFHKQGEETSQQFNLGKFAANLTDVDEINSEIGTTGASLAYVREIYDEGSVCDVKDIHRLTEVRYVCSNSQDTAMTSIREVHSCSYQIIIATPLICQHPAFQGIQDPIHTITCYPTKEPSNLDKQEAHESSDIQEGQGVSTESLPQEAVPKQSHKATGSSEQGVGTGRGLEIDLDTLSEEAMDELVSSMIRQTSNDDPDIDFLGLIEDEKVVEADKADVRHKAFEKSYGAWTDGGQLSNEKGTDPSEHPEDASLESQRPEKQSREEEL